MLSTYVNMRSAYVYLFNSYVYSMSHMSTWIAICVDLCRACPHMNARPWPVPLAGGSAGCAVHFLANVQVQDCVEYILISPSPARIGPAHRGPGRPGTGPGGSHWKPAGRGHGSDAGAGDRHSAAPDPWCWHAGRGSRGAAQGSLSQHLRVFPSQHPRTGTLKLRPQ